MKNDNNKERSELALKKWSTMLDYVPQNMYTVPLEGDRTTMARAFEREEIKWYKDSEKLRCALTAVRKGVDIINEINTFSKTNPKLEAGLKYFDYIDDITEAVYRIYMEIDSEDESIRCDKLGYAYDLYRKPQEIDTRVEEYTPVELAKNENLEFPDYPEKITAFEIIQAMTRIRNSYIFAEDNLSKGGNPYKTYKSSINVLREHGYTLKEIGAMFDVGPALSRKRITEYISDILNSK